MSRILPLSAGAISQIHSSKHITSLQGVVLALVENSLDAGASRVDMLVDFCRGGCTVEDNGSGILSSEFDTEGGLGKMHHTSKRSFDEGEHHGSTGTYLTQLAAMSLMSITSRHQTSIFQASLTIHHGKIISRQVPAPATNELVLSPAHGTRIEVTNLFGNMPVRVKQRAIDGVDGAGFEKAWQELKRSLAALLLAWPRPCAIRLKDAQMEQRSANLASSSPSTSGMLTERSLNQLKGRQARFELKDALPVLFQAGLAPPESRQSWVPVSASALGLIVKGSICMEPAPIRHCQFISIGISPCGSDSGHSELYAAVNKIFSHSSFGSNEAPVNVDDAEKDRRKHDRRYKNDGYTQKQLQNRKGVDRWPMFVLQIRLQSTEHHHSVAERISEDMLKAMIDVLEAMVTQWLAAHQFRPRKKRRRKNEQQEGPSVSSSSPLRLPSGALSSVPATPALQRSAAVSASTSKKRKIIDLSERPLPRDREEARRPYFSGLSRIKSGNGGLYDEVWETKKPATAPAKSTAVEDVLEDVQSKPLRHPFKLAPLRAGELSAVQRNSPTAGTQDQNHAVQATSSDDYGSVDDAALLEVAQKADQPVNVSEAVPNDGVISWTDPTTKQVYQVNTRTGVVLPVRSLVETTNSVDADGSRPVTRQRAAINTSMSSAGKALSLSHRQNPDAERNDSVWLPGFLREWDNPVFAKQDEERIPVASFDGPGNENAETGTRKLSKAGLGQSRVINQVDDKFILCSMPGLEDKQTLVLVDQHAASERVILEGLFEELCMPIDQSSRSVAYQSNLGYRSAVQTVMLDPSQRFQVSENEAELFKTHAQRFADWGILYDLHQRSMVPTALQVREATVEHRLVVRALPPGIAERCTLFPNLLIELLRSEVWELAQSSKSRFAAPVDTNEQSWLRRIGSCPQGIVDMLNSRACRSAIMFNDKLSVLQCEDLLSKLSACAFPFMCAHGRVSMVPLVDLGHGDGSMLGDGPRAGSSDAPTEYSRAFRDWKHRDDLDTDEAVV